MRAKRMKRSRTRRPRCKKRPKCKRSRHRKERVPRSKTRRPRKKKPDQIGEKGGPRGAEGGRTGDARCPRANETVGASCAVKQSVCAKLGASPPSDRGT